MLAQLVQSAALTGRRSAVRTRYVLQIKGLYIIGMQAFFMRFQNGVLHFSTRI